MGTPWRHLGDPLGTHLGAFWDRVVGMRRLGTFWISRRSLKGFLGTFLGPLGHFGTFWVALALSGDIQGV